MELIARSIAFLVMTCFVLFVYWLGGNDFVRSEGMALTAMIAPLAGLFAASCPDFKKMRKN